MPRIEPSLMPVVSDLARGLRELKVPFVGALVPELLLDVRPRRMTNDANRPRNGLLVSRCRWVVGSAEARQAPTRCGPIVCCLT
jgi:hypothetical protein